MSFIIKESTFCQHSCKLKRSNAYLSGNHKRQNSDTSDLNCSVEIFFAQWQARLFIESKLGWASPQNIKYKMRVHSTSGNPRPPGKSTISIQWSCRSEVKSFNLLLSQGKCNEQRKRTTGIPLLLFIRLLLFILLGIHITYYFLCHQTDVLVTEDLFYGVLNNHVGCMVRFDLQENLNFDRQCPTSWSRFWWFLKAYFEKRSLENSVFETTYMHVPTPNCKSYSQLSNHGDTWNRFVFFYLFQCFYFFIVIKCDC